MSASTLCTRLAHMPGVFEQVFVKGIAGRGVHEQEALAVEGEAAGHGQLQQIAAFFGPSASHIDGLVALVR